MIDVPHNFNPHSKLNKSFLHEDWLKDFEEEKKKQAKKLKSQQNKKRKHCERSRSISPNNKSVKSHSSRNSHKSKKSQKSKKSNKQGTEEEEVNSSEDDVKIVAKSKFHLKFIKCFSEN